MQDYKKFWTKAFSEKFTKAYPAEQLIKIFKGNYPNLRFDKDLSNKNILDMGSANGRNTALMIECGFKEIVACDISQDLIDLTRSNVESVGGGNYTERVKYILGVNEKIPIADNYFDFVVSWGVSYYMSSELIDYSRNLSELSRILKNNGILILDNPQKNADIYNDTINVRHNYWKNKDGIILRRFDTLEEFIKELEPYFCDFATSELSLDCFGRNDSRYTVVCRKK